MRRRRPSPVWVWPKVVLALLLLDLGVFHSGLFWRIGPPDFGATLASVTWSNVWALARELAMRPAVPGTVLVVGSSVVWAGVDVPGINASFTHERLPVTATRLTAFGQSCTDSAILVARGMRLDPWLAIYGAAVRDFNRRGAFDTPVARIFYDASVPLPALRGSGADAALEPWLKRYWSLYRYRFFVRRELVTGANALVGLAAPGMRAFAATEEPSLPPEALERFLAQRVTPESWATWQRWRASRRFTDYVAWLNASGGHVLEEYKRQTLDNFGPEDNPHAASLDWMLDFTAQHGVRGVLIYFPENPAFRDPEARPYFDPELSAAWAERFASAAARHGARFVDLRDFLPPEDFYDLIHPNLVGMRKISARLAEIAAEEWRARGATGG